MCCLICQWLSFKETVVVIPLVSQYHHQWSKYYNSFDNLYSRLSQQLIVQANNDDSNVIEYDMTFVMRIGIFNHLKNWLVYVR